MAKYGKYSEDFKLQTAKLITEHGYSYKQIAQRLDIADVSICNWVQKFRQTGELPSESQTQSNTDKLRELRKELARLKMENDILKKTASYFAK
jgi:transposase